MFFQQCIVPCDRFYFIQIHWGLTINFSFFFFIFPACQNKLIKTSLHKSKHRPKLTILISNNLISHSNVKYTILSCLFSGRNVTDSIAPLVRGVALPLRPVPIDSSTSPSSSSFAVEISQDDKAKESIDCTTADGNPGKCQDLSNCPQLLLDLTKLRQSLCFKSLFVPGVCCQSTDKTDINDTR